MMLALAAAAAVVVSPSGDSAQVRVDLAGLEPAAVRRAVGTAARRVCRAIETDSEAYARCAADAARRSLAAYEQRRARRSLVASR